MIDDEAPPRRQAPKPVTTVAELDQLDADAIPRGYRAGLDSAPDYGERDRGYWHGYLNGQVDRGIVTPSPEQMALVRDYVNRRRLDGAPISLPPKHEVAK